METQLLIDSYTLLSQPGLKGVLLLFSLSFRKRKWKRKRSGRGKSLRATAAATVTVTATASANPKRGDALTPLTGRTRRKRKNTRSTSLTNTAEAAASLTNTHKRAAVRPTAATETMGEPQTEQRTFPAVRISLAITIKEPTIQFKVEELFCSPATLDSHQSFLLSGLPNQITSTEKQAEIRGLFQVIPFEVTVPE